MHGLFNSEKKEKRALGGKLLNQTTVHVQGICRPVQLYNSSLCVDLLQEKHWDQ